MIVTWANSQGGAGAAFIMSLGPVAWYRKGIGITIATGVSQWNDQSGNGRNLLQATAGFQPAVQADNSILFDGNDDFLQAAPFTLNQPETIYMRVNPVSWTGGDTLCDGNAALTATVFQINASPEIDINAGASTVCANTALVVGAFGSLAVVVNGASSIIQVNATNSATQNPGAGNMGGFTMGARPTPANFANIAVKEGIIFAAAHAQATRD